MALLLETYEKGLKMNSKWICKMCGNKMNVIKEGQFLKIVCTYCHGELTKEVKK